MSKECAFESLGKPKWTKTTQPNNDQSKYRNLHYFPILIGVGHLARCSTIAKALSSISHVTMFSGGKPIEGYSAPSGVDFVQLPAIRRDRAAGIAGAC